MTTAVTDFQEFNIDALKEMVILKMQAQSEQLAPLAPHPEYEGQLQTLTRIDARAKKGDGTDSILGQFAMEALGASAFGMAATAFGSLVGGGMEAYGDLRSKRHKAATTRSAPVTPIRSAKPAFSQAGAGRITVRPAAQLPTSKSGAQATVKANKAEAWAAYRRDMPKRVRIERHLQEMSLMLDTLDALKIKGIERVIVTPEGRLIQHAHGNRRFHAPSHARTSKTTGSKGMDLDMASSWAA